MLKTTDFRQDGLKQLVEIDCVNGMARIAIDSRSRDQNSRRFNRILLNYGLG